MLGPESHDPMNHAAVVRARLFARVSRSAAAARALRTVRSVRVGREALVPGVMSRPLYRASATALRPGEPATVSLVDLEAGARWNTGASAAQRECLVLRGQLRADGRELAECDYVLLPSGDLGLDIETEHGALLYWREAPLPALDGETRRYVLDTEAGWTEFAPGIQRRLLWQRGAQAAMLYRTQPGAGVPHHGHGHDEECLMLRGEVFLDDVLLRPLDWQLAPAGSEHQAVSTDVGGILYAHGDVDLRLID